MNKPLRVPDVLLRKGRGPKLTMLTAYDASTARLLAETGAVDMLLVGDSLGMVQLGFNTTVPVTMRDMVRHTQAVRAGAPDALIVADMPFLSHQLSPSQALRNAGKLVQQGGAAAVKIEGGREAAPTIQRIVGAGIPVVGHLGLRPQSVHLLGGFRRQAQTPEQQDQLLADAQALEAAGVFAIVLESVPEDAAERLTAQTKVPIIGIGAGPDCDGQVLVIHDVIGLSSGMAPGFAKKFADGRATVQNAARWFAEEVRAGQFPRRRREPAFHVISGIAELRELLKRKRFAGESIGLVPTMGALHSGHASLLKRARGENDCVVATIFVNPLQFDRKSDLDQYPRTLEADLALCRQHGVSIVFTPAPDDLYPHEQLSFVETPQLGQTLCAAFRPGHFRGVETVVLKLLNIVQPDRAYFGEKDAQQLAIIRRLVTDLNVPVAIVPVPTVREPDGVALSSRNRHLSPEERSMAPALIGALRLVATTLDAGERSAETLKELALAEVASHPEIRLEYLELVDPETLASLRTVQDRALIAGAIWLGTTRLIDNLLWTAAPAKPTPNPAELPLSLVASFDSEL